MDQAATIPAAATHAAETRAPEVLDLRGLKCPMPVLRTRKALRRLVAGRALRVLTTDPLAFIDIPNLVREDGHRLVEATREADGGAVFVIVTQAARPPSADCRR